MSSPHAPFIEPVWIIGFTGHRPKDKPGRTSSELEHLAPKIRDEISALKARAKAQGGRAEFLCGVAAGADLIAAREAAALDMPVHVILPMPEHLYQADFNAVEWALAEQFIHNAKVGIGGATFRISHGSQLRDDCYYDLGMQIVYASDAVIALWDGTAAPLLGHEDGRGGTADVIDLAEADRMPYVRSEPDETPYAWLSTPVRLINTQTGTVTGKAENFADSRDAGLFEIKKVEHATGAEHGPTKPLNSVKDLMSFIDAGAKDWASNLRKTLLWGSGLHFSASLIAAISAGAQAVVSNWTPPVLALVELMLVLGAVALMGWAHYKHAQARWLELRLATELTRALVGSGRLLDPLFPLVTDHLPGWRRFCISVSLTIWRDPSTDLATHAKNPEQAFKDEKQQYLTARVQDQLGHYLTYDPSQHWWHHMIQKSGPYISALAVGFIALALKHKWEAALLHRHETDLLGSLLYYFLPIALPLLAGAIASLQSVTDAKRRAQVYPEMVERLQCARDLLPAIRTPASLRTFVRRTEEVLLDELVGWYAAAKGISH